MKRSLKGLVHVCVLLTVFMANAAGDGDTQCYGYPSKTNHFACGAHGNCVWWAASKRDDLAAAIDASKSGGWNGGQWYDKLKAMGFPVGTVPKPGAVVEFVAPGPEHVAYVEKVNADGSFDVTEMDWYGSLGTGNGVQVATYSPNGAGTYSRNHGSTRWTLKGFIYANGAASATDTTCDPTKRKCDVRIKGDVGWYPPVSDCQNATQWFKLTRDTTNKVSRVDPATKSACPLACYAN